MHCCPDRRCGGTGEWSSVDCVVAARNVDSSLRSFASCTAADEVFGKSSTALSVSTWGMIAPADGSFLAQSTRSICSTSSS